MVAIALAVRGREVEESRYTILKQENLLKKLKERKKEGLSYRFVSDEQVQVLIALDDDSPWLLNHSRKERKCLVWHNVYFGIYGVVPTPCLKHCWKVVITRMWNDDGEESQLDFSAVMKIAEFQENFEWPSKVGMDRRAWTPNLWGAYWYCDTLEQAREIRKVLETDLSSDFIVEIKRGCTEMELMLGDSGEWDVCDPRCEGQKQLEISLDAFIYNEIGPLEQPVMVKRDVILRMMYWAHKHGDMTYLMHMNPGEQLTFEMPRGPVKWKPSRTYR